MYYNGMSLKDAKGQTNSVFRNLYPSKTQVNNQLIDVDTFTPKLDISTSQSYIQELSDIDKQVKAGTITWQEYHDSLDEGTRYIAKYGQETQGQIRTVEGLQQANQNARASIIAQNKAIEQSTLSAKASQVALKGLTMVGNMVAGMLIGMAVQWAIGAIDDWIHSVENAKKNAEEFTTTLKDSQKTQSENSSTISSLNDEYKELSKGVNSLGENVSLTSDEYARYHEITNQVAGIMPNLVSGYDEQGNAILKVRGNLANLNDEYAKYQQQEAIKLTKDEKSDDIFTDFQNKATDVQDNSSGGRFLFGSEFNPSTENLIDRIYTLKKLVNMSQDDLEENFETYSNILEPLGFKMDMVADEFETFHDKFQSELASVVNEIETAASSVDYYASNFAKSVNKFWDLNDSSQSYVNKLLGNMSYDFIYYNSLDNKENLEAFTIKLISSIKDNKGQINDAFTSLFEIDIDKLDPKTAQEKVTSYVQTIAKELGIKSDLSELKKSLGFEEVDELAESYSQTLNNAKEKFGEDLTSFFEKNSINTQDELDSWTKIVRITNDATEAKKKYLALGGRSFDDWNSMFDGVKIGKADSSNDRVKGYEKQANKIAKMSKAGNFDDNTTDISDYVDETKKEIEKAKNNLKAEKENLEGEWKKLKDWGLSDYADKLKNNTLDAKFGNVDMDSRVIIKWSEKLKEKYKKELKSWDYDPEIGSIDTVFGGSGRFGEDVLKNGVEIAFTPILNNGKKAELLDQNTLYDYIEQIVQDSTKNGKISSKRVLELDAKGLTINGKDISNVIAGVDTSLNYDNNGNIAETFGRLMHFTGKFGAIELAEKSVQKFSNKLTNLKGVYKDLSKLQKFAVPQSDPMKEFEKDAKEANMTLLDYASIVKLANERQVSLNDCLNIFATSSYYSSISSLVGAVDDYSTAVENAKKSTDALQTALTEQNNQGYLTQETYQALIDLDSDYSNCLEFSAGYMVLNAEKANEMAKAKSETTLAELEFKEALDVKQYNENTSAIERNKERIEELKASKDSSSEAIQSEISALEQQNETLLSNNDGLKTNIEKYDMLESNIRGTTSAYQEFLDALSGGNDGDRYNKMFNGLEDLNELYESGGLESSKGKALTDAYFGEDFKTSNYKEALKNVKKYLTEDKDGYNQFLKDLVSTGNATEKNGQIFIKSTKEKIKKDLGMTDALIEAMLDISKFYGHDLEFKSSTDGANNLKDATNQTDVAIEQMQKNIDYLNKLGIDTTEMQKELDAFKEKVNQTKAAVAEGLIPTLDDSQESFERFNKQINPLVNSGVKSDSDSSDVLERINGVTGANVTPEQLEQAKKNKAANDTFQEISKNGGDATTVVETLSNKIQGINDLKINDPGFEKINSKLGNVNGSLSDMNSKLDSLNGKKVTIDIKTTTSKENEESGDKPKGKGYYGTVGNAFSNGTFDNVRNLPITGYKGLLHNEKNALRSEYGQPELTVYPNGKTELTTKPIMSDLPKGTVIFNESQTKKIMNGNRNGFGNAYGTGTDDYKITGSASYVTSKGSRSGASNSSSSKKDSNNSSKNTKTSDTSSTVFDWIERKLDYLADKTQKTIDKITDYIKQSTKNKRYKTLLNNIDDEIEANEKAAKKYQNKADKVAKKNNLSSKWIKKIKTGNYTIQEIKNSDKADAINDYIDWYEKAQSAKDTAREKRLEKKEKTREALDSRLEYRNNKLTQKQTKADSIQYNIDLAEANGRAVSSSYYTKLSNNANKQITNLEGQNKLLLKYQATLKKNSAEWFDIQQQIDDNNESIDDLVLSQVEWNNTIQEMRLDKFEHLSDLLDGIKSRFEAILSLNETQGYTTTDEEILKQITIDSSQISVNNDKINQYWANIREDMMKFKGDSTGWGLGFNDEDFKIFKESYEDYINGVIDNSTFKYQLQNILGLSWDNFINNTELQEALTSINDLDVENIGLMQEQEELLDSIAEKRIDAIQDYIDKLNEANDAKSKAIELEKLQQALQAEKQNRSSFIYHEGYGFNYEANQSAINEAQSALDDYQFDAFIDSLSDIIDLIQEGIDNGDFNLYDKEGNSLGDPDTIIKQYLASISGSLANSFADLEFYTDDKGKVLVRQKGNAYVYGVVNAPRGSHSLVGEESPEILVRDGQWNLIGQNGAEFIDTKPGDIIFDGKKTEELLKNGFINSRGKAFNQGTGNYESLKLKPLENVFFDKANSTLIDSIAPINSCFESIQKDINRMQTSLSLIQPGAVGQNQIVQIENVTLPNINDLSKAQELFDGLMTIGSDAVQRANKR